MPYTNATDGRTHSRGCWRTIGHHDCAQRRIIELEAGNKALLDALERVFPFMKEAADNGLAGDEGCYWPLETVRTAIAQAKPPADKAL